jgi:transposase-like protein
MNCQYCDNSCVKYGKQKDGTQKYRCPVCNKIQQERYTYNACANSNKELFREKMEQKCGILNTAKTLQISPVTIIKWNKQRLVRPIHDSNREMASKFIELELEFPMESYS